MNYMPNDVRNAMLIKMFSVFFLSQGADSKFLFFFSSRRRHTRSLRDWSSDVCLFRSTGVVVNAPNLGWRDVAFGEMLRAAVGVPVRIANDLSVAAWGEKRFGAAKGISDVVLVFVGSGVGSGLILGGRLHEGAHGVAGEFGHVKVRPARPGTGPRRCGCGQVGCLEAYTSGMNVAARVREEMA